MSGIVGLIFRAQKTVINAKDSGLGGALGKIGGVLRQTIGGVAGISIDATLQETHSSSCTIARDPVEDGSNITDHVEMDPVKLTLECVISDTPLGYLIVGNIQNTIRSAQELFGKETRSHGKWNDLRKLQESRTPFTVVTGLKRYTNMLITNLSLPITAQDGNSIHFTIDMEQIRIVKSKTGDLNLSDSVSDIGAGKKDFGQRVTDVVPASSNLSSSSVTTTSPPSTLSELTGLSGSISVNPNQ